LCVGYKSRNGHEASLPVGANALSACEPVYVEMPGWSESTQGIRRYEDLPQRARDYLKRIEEVVEAKIAIISTGPDRVDTITLDNPFSS